MAQEYDCVPVVDSGRICGLVDTQQGRIRDECLPIVVPSGTPLVDVVEKVCDLKGGCPTMIVLGEGENYEGALDHTDLDKPQVSTMLYAIFSDFEVRITALISKLPQEDWLACLGPTGRERIAARFADKETRRLELDMLHCTFLVDKVQIVKATDGLWRQLGFNSEKDAGRLFIFNDWRNRISHKTEEDEGLLYEKAELEELGELLKMIENSLDLLSSADRN